MARTVLAATGARGAAAALAPRMARLYATSRSGGPRATPHPPVGVACDHASRDRALAPPGHEFNDRHIAGIDLAPFERRLCRRNPILGEASEGAVEAPSE